MTKLANYSSLAVPLSLSSVDLAAEEVTTTSLETGIPVTGELLSYDDDFGSRCGGSGRAS